MPPDRVVISDVAAAAGVSPTTVSHALSGRRAVSEETRRRVLKVVGELGYRSSIIAQSLRNQQTNSVAFLVVDISNPYYPTVAQSVHDGLADEGYVSLIGITYGEPATEETMLHNIVRRNVDGLIFQPMSLSPLEIRRIVGSLPLVLITDHEGELHADQVQTNDAQGIAEAVRHLKDRGFTEVGFIGGPDGRSPGTVRLASFRAAAHALGLTVADHWIEHVPFNRDGGREAGLRLLKPADRPRAIVCANDVIAVGLFDAAHDLGLDIPRDVAVVGFDDIEVASMLKPRLTTVRNPARDVGAACVEAVLSRIASGPETPYTVRSLPTVLLPREST
ncbi:LacI family transcriptional regulator (plasmid) [Mycolicibacterium arabiense]|uniref:LacI family transcriptional regulator n=1 Tax=Mycolicibacterium arabiense TaxID=1286181 RepID=A0A7I7RQ78_9MYCO|nr:LacI family DNA-binding transcriptional regulator [Mycolicibacterium arabiense]MCV7371986.1 LacI family DNA-binding transcriptional regulator [Mycolicibacterium arabiense]BBY46693.1 LacI family transcriptional regulator [Mycolicibacterium arabiense]